MRIDLDRLREAGQQPFVDHVSASLGAMEDPEERLSVKAMLSLAAKLQSAADVLYAAGVVRKLDEDRLRWMFRTALEGPSEELAEALDDKADPEFFAALRSFLLKVAYPCDPPELAFLLALCVSATCIGSVPLAATSEFVTRLPEDRLEDLFLDVMRDLEVASRQA